jgi:hypothetical protein
MVPRNKASVEGAMELDCMQLDGAMEQILTILALVEIRRQKKVLAFHVFLDSIVEGTKHQGAALN